MASRTRHAAPLALIALVLIVAANVIAPAATNRSYFGGNRSLEMDGANVGFLRSFSGCKPQSDVVVSTVGAGGTIEKHVATLRFERCVLTLGNNMGKPLYDWIQAAFDHKAARKDLVIVLSDFDHKETSRLSLSSASITSVLLPGLNAASKDAAFITLEVQPESVRIAPSSGSTFPQPSKTTGLVLLPSNYRLEMNNVTQPAVSRMSPIVLRVTSTEPPLDGAREGLKSPDVTTLDDLNVSVATSQAGPFTSWAQDFIVKGDNDQSKERTIRVSYLSANRQSILFQVTLRGVGIYGGDIYLPSMSAFADDSVPRSTFLLYAEEASFVATPGGVV